MELKGSLESFDFECHAELGIQKARLFELESDFIFSVNHFQEFELGVYFASPTLQLSKDKADDFNLNFSANFQLFALSCLTHIIVV